MERSNRNMWKILVQIIQLRVGEASNPGPKTNLALTIGAINAAGLGNKGTSLQDLPIHKDAIWGVCETHLTKPGIAKFNNELKIKKSPYRLHHGEPAPFRFDTASSISGKHVGVGFLSTIPSRRLMATWPADQAAEARFSMQTFFCQNRWIHGAACYGHAHKAENVAVRNQTDSLLESITERVVYGMKGFRFIVGDFNQPHGSLQQTALWEQLGWKEIQVLWGEKFHRPIQPTCKSVSVKDFVWISPELQPFLEDIEVVDHIFPDHAVLCAHFRPFFKPETVYLWRKPKNIDWDTTPEISDGGYSFDHSKTPSENLTQIANTFEDRVHETRKTNGQTGLQSSQRGRAKTTGIHKVCEHSKPLTEGRNGDFKPEVSTQSLQHHRWVKQLRRLESLTRNLSNINSTASSTTHAHREWRAILLGSGFHGGFRNWWEHRENIIPPAPRNLTHDLPTCAVVQAIYFTLEIEVRALEQVLKMDMHQKAINNRINNPNKIFQDFAKPKATPVQLLDESVQTFVKECDHEYHSVVLDKDSFDENYPIQHASGVYEDWARTESGIIFPDTLRFHVGDILWQDKVIGSLEDIFTKFGESWKARWDKHRDIPTEEWKPISDFFRCATPKVAAYEYKPITIQEWHRSLQSKKKHAAIGPDGFSRADLMRMPQDITQALLDLFTAIECGNDWPEQLVTGIVHSLEKIPHASKINQFRPITIFSVAYRNWSSIRARQALRHLVDHSPSGCYGNLPGRSTTQVWYQIQTIIENHHHLGQFTSGAVLDIEKCFNHLPRQPLLDACEHLGMPKRIVSAWQRGLQAMQRRFHIRGSTGPAIFSSTGFAEGCPLSVVAMVAANCVIARWVELKTPSVNLWSFVDNIEVTASTPTEVLQGCDALQTICGVLDLTLDSDKSIVWSTSPEGRKEFREGGHRPQAWARDLGGHVQYNRQNTNSVITDKIRKFKPRWGTLIRSKATYTQKLRAIKTAGYPNALHGISSVTLGDENYDELRTGGVRSLGEHHNGTSPILHLSLVEHPSSDPGYFALWSTIKDFRQHMPKETAICILKALIQPSHRVKPEVGPCSVMLHRIHQIRWFWDDTKCFFRDHHCLPVDIWECPIQELAIRVTEAWQTRVASEISWRKTMGGLEHVCPTVSQRKQNLTPQENSIMRKVQNGTFYTADHLKHRSQGQATECMFCGAEDNVEHRFWHCPVLEPARKTCPAQVRNAIASMSPATKNHGWLPEPQSLWPFREKLISLPDYSFYPELPEQIPEFLELFTDGCCLKPQSKLCRLGAWGVVVATPGSNQEFVAVASGILKGFHQTVARAELTAAIAAVRTAIKADRKFRLWIDNAYVVKTIKRCTKWPNWEIKSVSPNHDLLVELQALLGTAASLFSGVCKVNSHQQRNTHTPWYDQWAFNGNDAADRTAASAYQSHPDLIAVWTSLCNEISELESLRDTLHRVFLDVSQLSLKLASEVQRQHRNEERVEDLHNDPVTMDEWVLPMELPEGLQEYDTGEWKQLATWIETLHCPTGQIYRWTWYQLFLDYHLNFPGSGPWYHQSSKTWRPANTRPTQDLTKCVRWFNSFLQRVAKKLGQPLPTKHMRPDSTVLAFWSNTLTVKTSEERQRKVDEWLSEWNSCFAAPKELAHVTLT